MRTFAAPAAPAIRRTPSSPSKDIQKGGGALKERRSEEVAAVYRGASELASQAESGAARIFQGSSDGRSYAADSPVLGKFFGPKPVPVSTRTVPVRRDTSPVASSSSAATVAAKPRSLKELCSLPTAELRQMLAERGVGPGTATDKDSLAEWVFQHQNLPVVQQSSRKACAAKASTAKSVAELQKLPVAELRDMLMMRGVSSSGKTEKSELVEWVWQHQHLPVQYQSRREQHGAGHSRTKHGTSERLKGDEVVTTAEADANGDEDEEAKLLTEGSPKKEESSKIWKMMGAAAVVAAAGVAGAAAMSRRR